MFQIESKKSISSGLETRYNDIEKYVTRLEEKFTGMISSMEKKVDHWKQDALEKITSMGSIPIDLSDSLLQKKVIAQENEIELLQGEMSNKQKLLENVTKDNINMKVELNKIGCQLEMLNTAKFDLNVENDKLHTRIKELNLRIATLDGQNNLLVISSGDKDNRLGYLQNEINKLSNNIGRREGEINKLEETIKILKSIYTQNKGQQIINTQVDESINAASNDAIIFHDSLFKYISEGIMKNEGLKVEKVFTPRLSDVLEKLGSLRTKPKVVVVHCATNDLAHMEENEIVDKISEIYELASQRGIKVIYSTIVPRKDAN